MSNCVLKIVNDIENVWFVLQAWVIILWIIKNIVVLWINVYKVIVYFIIDLSSNSFLCHIKISFFLFLQLLHTYLCQLWFCVVLNFCLRCYIYGISSNIYIYLLDGEQCFDTK